MQPIDPSILHLPTTEAAKALLGKVFVKIHGDTPVGGIIVETEAYLHDDPACHASRGNTKRNEVMFWEAGHIYVYFTYGMHWCANIVTNEAGIGEAVLIRAVEPLPESIASMQHNRKGIRSIKELANGPAKLTQAMGITGTDNGKYINKQDIFLYENPNTGRFNIISTPRIGISAGTHLPYRYCIEHSEYLSRKG